MPRADLSPLFPPAAYNEFLEHIGRVVFHFNTLERGMHAIFAKLATDWSDENLRAKHWIVTAHISNMSMCDAIATITNEFHDRNKITTESKNLVLHCIKTFNLTREYRNWYIHGFNGIGVNKGNLSIQLHTFSARNHFNEHAEFVSIADLKWFSGWCQTAAHHVAEAHSYVARDLGYNIGGIKPPLPEIWPLPNRLTKPSHRRLYNPRPPQS